MRLSKRIKDICECVESGESLADIGTDHAYVPMLLIKKGVASRVIMSDVSEGSLAKARETFLNSHIDISDNCFRIADGLDEISFGEVDDIIIAGLGGYTIIDILSKDIGKSKSFKKLILQPRKFSGELRKYLLRHGWKIDLEKLSPEGKFICEIIVASPGDNSMQYDYPDDDIRWSYPDTFSNVNYGLLKQRIDWKLSSIDDEIINLKKSNKDYIDLVKKLNIDKEYLIELLDKCSNNNFG